MYAIIAIADSSGVVVPDQLFVNSDRENTCKDLSGSHKIRRQQLSQHLNSDRLDRPSVPLPAMVIFQSDLLDEKFSRMMGTQLRSTAISDSIK